MGQCIGSSHQLDSLDEQPKTRFYKSKNGNLSATFHILDCDLHWDLLNVNIATEEQLMTLPGVNRAIARNIIDYRQAIGGYKKVEDLALVSGVGASKLEHFRAEICVNSRRKIPDSLASSRDQSLESLLSIETNSRHQRPSPLKTVNVNTANMFQLMTVRGMSQEMAANIIHYRERKGPFKNIDELLKVKSVTPQKLSRMRLFIMVDTWTIKKDNRSFSPSTPQINPLYKKRTHHRRTKSAPPCHSDIKKLRTIDESTQEVYELLSRKCSRPIPEKTFSFTNNGRPCFRVGLWNLQCFSVDKAKNPGVMEVVCRTILENGISLVAVHEVISDNALALISAELNDPQLTNVENWSGERGKWKYIAPPAEPPVDNAAGKHHKMLSGFLYDTSRGLELCSLSPLTLEKEKLNGYEEVNSVIMGRFKMEKLEFVIISIYCKQDNSLEKTFHLLSVVDALQEQISEEKDILIIGNISIPAAKKENITINHSEYCHLLPEGTSTNLVSNHQESFIVSNQNIKKIFTGNWGVIREGLSHLAIPNGWLWGGSVGDSCPVWVEIYATNSADTPLANGVCQVLEENCTNSVNSQPVKEETCKKRRWLDTWSRKKKNQTELTENGKTIFLN
ncbi:endonuclease/exonuclease/phosphatase family domain-containing protein 1-like [Centruroides vittatus]|uniref:endonuclease/exonuclease/phosphatase family domain-containing protein 1-like n=1 Tax=Centruroides vittatus TaxID=120091 RepID=UPI00350FDBF2